MPDGSPLIDFDHFHYVPLLYARGAEFGAVSTLAPDVKSGLTPLWVIPPVAKDPQTDLRKKSFTAHIEDVSKKLARAWGAPPVFVDAHHFRHERNGPTHALLHIVRQLRAEGITAIPVLHDEADETERTAAETAAAEGDSGIALRVSSALWADLGNPTADARLAQLIDSTGLPLDELDLLLDLGDQVTTPPNMSAAAVKGAMLSLPTVGRWRTLTVLGTSMPATTSNVGKDNSAEIARAEWAMWKLLRAGLPRRPAFGDYGIQSLDVLSTFNPLYMQVAAQLRYTIANSWYVARGSSTRTAGFGQAHGLAAEIVAHPEFAGESFSTGDEWIVSCANAKTGPGNAQKWREATTNHHLAFVTSQLASLRGD